MAQRADPRVVPKPLETAERQLRPLPLFARELRREAEFVSPPPLVRRVLLAVPAPAVCENEQAGGFTRLPLRTSSGGPSSNRPRRGLSSNRGPNPSRRSPARPA
jgi:hypothetical protein